MTIEEGGSVGLLEEGPEGGSVGLSGHGVVLCSPRVPLLQDPRCVTLHARRQLPQRVPHTHCIDVHHVSCALLEPKRGRGEGSLGILFPLSDSPHLLRRSKRTHTSSLGMVRKIQQSPFEILLEPIQIEISFTLMRYSLEGIHPTGKIP